jgi:hypothetical protein
METEEERKAILAKLMLLAEVRKLHEWTAFGQKEAEEFEAAEAEIDSEGSGSATD